MCGLCGALGGGRHWSDSAGREGFDASEKYRSRREERRRRTALINRLLASQGLAIEDWAGSSYILHTKRGAVTEVSTLPDLWLAIERETGEAIDPLDPAFLAAASGAANG
jgi:hypothetical protein